MLLVHLAFSWLWAGQQQSGSQAQWPGPDTGLKLQSRLCVVRWDVAKYLCKFCIEVSRWGRWRLPPSHGQLSKLYTLEGNGFYLKQEVTSLTNRKGLKSRSDGNKWEETDPWLGASLSWWHVTSYKSPYFIERALCLLTVVWCYVI